MRGMFNVNKDFSQRFFAFSLTVGLVAGTSPQAFAADSDLNFKIYNPPANGNVSPTDSNYDSASVAEPAASQSSTAAPAADAASAGTALKGLQDSSQVAADAPADTSSTTTTTTKSSDAPSLLRTETPVSDSKPATETPTAEAPAADTSGETAKLREMPADTTSDTATTDPKPAVDAKSDSAKLETAKSDDSTVDSGATAKSTDAAVAEGGDKVLQGYVRVVPTGTKIPIIMDTAVDSDTSQEGDEFSARTSEDLTIDGSTVVPAGSIIKGRIATLNSPKHLNRSGSVALKFDTITTPDNRQIPLVANLVARGGVVHARRGLKDYAIDTAEFTLPTALGVGIGAIAGANSSSVGTAGGALIGAGVGAAVGLAILLAKKGKKIDVRPGDELKIELAEDLRMPTL